MGFEDPNGERLYSYITFTSGAFPDHGVGTEERCYYDDELYRVYKFDWEIQNHLQPCHKNSGLKRMDIQL